MRADGWHTLADGEQSPPGVPLWHSALCETDAANVEYAYAWAEGPPPIRIAYARAMLVLLARWRTVGAGH